MSKKLAVPTSLFVIVLSAAAALYSLTSIGQPFGLDHRIALTVGLVNGLAILLFLLSKRTPASASAFALALLSTLVLGISASILYADGVGSGLPNLLTAAGCSLSGFSILASIVSVFSDK